MQTLATEIIEFYKNLKPPHLPRGIDILFPQQQPEVMKIVETFFSKYYGDNRPRRLIFGINPGRFGAGITGVNFTAPKQLSEYCGIAHSFKQQSEISAEFIYAFIEAYGGASKFYGDYFLTSVCPLGFVKKGLNLNYYDDKALQKSVTPFIVECIQQQLSIGFETDSCIRIGGDKNLKFFSALNDEHKFFDRLMPLPHPRFIMQYRRRQMETYIDQYLSVMRPSS